MASLDDEGEVGAPEAGTEQARVNLVVSDTGAANPHYEVGVCLLQTVSGQPP